MYQSLQEENKRHKIAFYIGNLARGGAQRVVVNLAGYLAKEGYEVLLVTAKKEQGEYPLAEKVKRIISDLTEEEMTTSRSRNFFARINKLRGFWKKERPDIIISFMGKSNMFALSSAFGLGIPVLVSVRSDPKREYSGKAMKLLSKTFFVTAKGVILQTEEAVRYFPWYIRRKAVIMPNSIDPNYIKERCGREKRRNEIITAGTIDANKNQKLLIQAFAKIEKEFPQMKLIIYGDGALRKELLQKVEELKLTEKVFLPGRENELYNKAWDSKIFVLTSNAEGMPNALIEAMAMGLAVISTDCPCGGPRTLIRDGENGLLIPVDDEKALEQALRRLLENPQFEEKLGAEAYKLSEEVEPQKVNRMWREYITSFLKESDRI